MDVDGPRLVLIKHIDHHPARLLTEVAHVPVDQGTLQLLCINLSTPVLVHSLEPLSNLRVHLEMEKIIIKTIFFLSMLIVSLC